MPERAATTPDHALKLLLEGNQRWVEGRSAHPNADAARRSELTAGQWPFATVFSCVDSRVPPELVFDRGLGDLVVVRSAGHVLDPNVLAASLQFGVDSLQTPLLLVLGHQACGAVTCAVEALEGDGVGPSGLEPIVDALLPAYEEAKTHAGDLIQNTIQIHTRLTAQRIAQIPQIASLTQSGDLRISAGYYPIDTGAVAILD